MRRLAMVAVVALLAPMAFETANAQGPDTLVGTWRQVSGKFNGKEFRQPEGVTLIKHITPTQFMFVDYDKDGKVTDAFGGTYSLKGGAYEETPLYGTGDVHGLKGKPQSFRCRVEGNRWYHSGTLSGGATLEEVWEREEPGRGR